MDSFKTYISRVRALLESQPRTVALIVGGGIAAALDDQGSLFGFYTDTTEAEEDAFDFDQSAWSGDAWDGETHLQTWTVIAIPVFISRALPAQI